MGIGKKLLSSGLGLTSEAIHAARSRSHSPGGPSSSSSTSTPARYADQATTSDSHLSAQQDGIIQRCDDKTEYGYDSDSSETNDLNALHQDEAAWELDDMVEELRPPPHEDTASTRTDPADPETRDSDADAQAKKEDEMVRRLLRMAGPPPRPTRRIPLPVIVPQRRPKQKSRGFVRAYAPVLADCGINQDVFLQFLEDFDQASKASSWIDVVFVAGHALGYVPEVAAQVVSAVIQVAAGTARELQSRHRRNTFLDRINQDLLIPRGLYAMVMTFKDQLPAPGQAQPQQSGILSNLSSSIGQAFFSRGKLDITQTAAKYSNPDPNMSKFKGAMKDLRLTSGTTHGEVELPESAELVFPDLDRAAAQALETTDQSSGQTSTGTRNKWKNAGSWVQDYLDRRSQAFYEAEHPNTSMVVPSSHREPLTSRYNDPNHPANSGSLISLLSGGVINPAPRRAETRTARRQRLDSRREARDVRRVARGRTPRGPLRDRGQRRSQRQRQPMIKKVLQQDVLYLLIVNLPSQEEIQESVSRLEHLVREESG